MAKSFSVYKLTDISDHLEVGIITKQITADKSNGAITRGVSTLNQPLLITTHPSTLTGAIQIYSSNTPPPTPWLVCDGRAVSRTFYRRLFSAIGIAYGAGDNFTTFNLPDLGGRVPLGVDTSQLWVENARGAGATGGQVKRQLTVAELPLHTHSTSGLNISAAGAHTHRLTDPGHNHTGQIGWERMGGSGRGMTTGGYSDDNGFHSHTIRIGRTGITMESVDNHTHPLSGALGSTGDSRPIDILPPFQAFNYIIYSD